MYSKTAQVVLVENAVPPQALCLTWKSPVDLGSMCLPQQHDLIVPQGRDADKVPRKEAGKIFKASPLLRPHPTSGPATSSLPPIAETEQPIVIEDDDAPMTGGSAGSAVEDPKATTGTATAKRCPLLKVPPSTRPRAVPTMAWDGRLPHDHSESGRHLLHHLRLPHWLQTHR